MGPATSVAASECNMLCPFPLARDFNQEFWMDQQQKHLQNKRLIDVRMAGTHGSASYSVFGALWQSAACQNCDCFQQLCRGERYLDIRVGWDGSIMVTR